jgi:hypothetical protein
MESSPPGTGRPQDRRWLRRTVVLLACVCTVAIGVAAATLLFGHIGGEEFCPAKFARRSFYYLEIPLVGLQVTSITRDDRTSDLERDLTQNGLVPTVRPGEPDWDLVYTVHSGVTTLRGDAAILCGYLDAKDNQGEQYWKIWTEKHPELAKVLWPLVAQTARRQLYLFVPELFELAAQATDPAQLDGDLRAVLSRNYVRFAENQQQLGHPQRAVELLDQALAYAPDDQTLKRRRAELAGASDELEKTPGR